MTTTDTRGPLFADVLGKAYPVLDQGFVRLVDCMGGDQSIERAARVSYGRDAEAGRDPAKTRTLLRFLMRHRHTTPFEMVELVFHVRAPMDEWRQQIRHRTASVNEYSTRYSEAINAAQRTEPDAWRAQSRTNKQGSGPGEITWPKDFDGEIGTDEGPLAYLSGREADLQMHAREVYEERLAFGVAREQARKDLPLSTYTEAYWKIDLHNLLHFLGLRVHEHAQQEIRAYATIMGALAREVAPVAFQAWEDYVLRSVRLSAAEWSAVRAAMHSGDSTLWKAGGLEKFVVDHAGLEGREADELRAKLAGPPPAPAWVLPASIPDGDPRLGKGAVPA